MSSQFYVFRKLLGIGKQQECWICSNDQTFIIFRKLNVLNFWIGFIDENSNSVVRSTHFSNIKKLEIKWRLREFFGRKSTFFVFSTFLGFRSTFDHNLTIKMIARQRRIFWYVSRKKCGFSTKKFSKSPLLIQKCIFYLNWAILVAVIVVWNFKKS